jgi:UDP-N-acetylglucosamine diphosphorylase/glucosamine-1-phosphate N-acetyltransferase
MHTVVLFDDRLGLTAPLTDLRASFDVRTGAFTTAGRWSRANGCTLAGVIVPDSIAQLVAQSVPNRVVNPALSADDRILLVNGRCPIPSNAITSLQPGEWLCDPEESHLAAANLTVREALSFLQGQGLPKGSAKSAESRVLISRPWHVRTLRDACIAHDLATFANSPSQPTPHGVIRFGEHHVHLSRSAKVYPTVVLDAESGPIVIDDNAVVRPGAILIGPLYVGPNSTVLERALIRPNTAIGPWCKVSGEIGGTIFQGYANKAHDGYLGDSWVGEWVNLGAGTTNSNLLNTYAEIIAKASHDGRNERTGETFLGAIIGDHVKTAICTRIMTGSVLATGGMFASTLAVSGSTQSFAWVTDAGDKRYRLEKFIEVMAAAQARRKVVATQAYVERIRALFAPSESPKG